MSDPVPDIPLTYFGERNRYVVGIVRVVKVAITTLKSLVDKGNDRSIRTPGEENLHTKSCDETGAPNGHSVRFPAGVACESGHQVVLSKNTRRGCQKRGE